MLAKKQKENKMLTNEQLEAIKSDEIASISDDVVLGIGAVGAAQSMTDLSYSGIDTITISSLDSLTTTPITTITLPSTTSGTSYTTSTGSWTSSPCYTINTGSTCYGTLNVSPPRVNFDGNGIQLDKEADIKLGDISLKEFLKKMEERLSILVPDPKKLEKFQALQKAYEHYKTLESLCFNEPEEEEQK
jgi:hypothetical protein